MILFMHTLLILILYIISAFDILDPSPNTNDDIQNEMNQNNEEEVNMTNIINNEQNNEQNKESSGSESINDDKNDE